MFSNQCSTTKCGPRESLDPTRHCDCLPDDDIKKMFCNVNNEKTLSCKKDTDCSAGLVCAKPLGAKPDDDGKCAIEYRRAKVVFENSKARKKDVGEQFRFITGELTLTE